MTTAGKGMTREVRSNTDPASYWIDPNGKLFRLPDPLGGTHAGEIVVLMGPGATEDDALREGWVRVTIRRGYGHFEARDLKSIRAAERKLRGEYEHGQVIEEIWKDPGHEWVPKWAKCPSGIQRELAEISRLKGMRATDFPALVVRARKLWIKHVDSTRWEPRLRGLYMEVCQRAAWMGFYDTVAHLRERHAEEDFFADADRRTTAEGRKG